MTNLSRTLKSGSWKVFKWKMGHGYKKVGNPCVRRKSLSFFCSLLPKKVLKSSFVAWSLQGTLAISDG